MMMERRALKIRCHRFLPLLLLALWLGARPALALHDVAAFEATYSAYDPSGRSPWRLPMRIYAPTKPGSYPVAIVLGGAGTCQDAPKCSNGYGTYASVVAEDAARRGMIAVAVHYDSGVEHFCGCTGAEAWTGRAYHRTLDCGAPFDGWDDKARAVFDHGDARSALRRIVAVTTDRPARASLAKGLVVFGHSQGSWMAHMADRYTRAGGGPVIAAALLSGTGIWGYVPGTTEPNPYPVLCHRPGAKGLVSSSRIRVLIGRDDRFFGVNKVAPPGKPSPEGTPVSRAGVRRSLHDVTGLCSSTVDKCLVGGRDGGGWRVVLAPDVAGRPDHAFMTSTDSSALGTIDAKWRHGWAGEPMDPPASLKENLNWLARRLGGGVLQVP
jgi:hypothetical protein